MTRTDQIIQTATSFLGQQEKPGNSGFKTSEFEAAMKRVGWFKGAAWCDFFAELVWTTAYRDDLKTAAILSKLFTGGTLRSFQNFKKSRLFTISMTPVPGALVYWKHSATTGHVGIVVEAPDGPQFRTVEGNTNDAGGREGYIVARRWRNLSEKSLLGFVYPPAGSAVLPTITRVEPLPPSRKI